MDFTGTFDGLGMDFATGKQKASPTLNEDAKQTFENLRDKKVMITIKAYRKKRSLDANAYFHVLVGKIADVTGNSKVYIKNKLIAEYGQYETINGALVPLPLDDDIDAYNVEFIHLQPTSRTTTNQKGKVFRVNLVMRGSHTYDTDEMSKLIDGTVSEAKDLGIETLTPNQIREMKERWGAKVEKETVERVHG